MYRLCFRTSALAFTVLIACAGGCGDDASGNGGEAGSGGTSAQAGGTNSGGGGSTCDSASDCPAPRAECGMAICEAGQCGFTPVPEGTPASTQTPGDCLVVVCDGAGAALTEEDNDDLPVDSDECTQDVCTAGIPSNPLEPAGAPCGADLACDAAGACTGCGVASQCPGVDDDCQTRTCTAAVCGFDFASAGATVSAQVLGDCLASVCDGAGGTIDEPDDLDLPDDGNDCTDDLCNAGVVEHPSLGAGTTCNQSGGWVCDGLGACVDSPLGTACSSGANCTSGFCVDGVCCEGACAGECVSCLAANTGSVDGVCSVITGGTDPDTECAGSVCGVAETCNGDTANPACESPCATFACHPSGVGCRTFCAGDIHCAPGFQCEAEQCVPMLALGDVCSTDGACDSGFCQGVCCAVDCANACDECALDGMSCVPSGASCTATRPCNGAGSCSGEYLGVALSGGGGWSIEESEDWSTIFDIDGRPAGDSAVGSINRDINAGVEVYTFNTNAFSLTAQSVFGTASAVAGDGTVASALEYVGATGIPTTITLNDGGSADVVILALSPPGWPNHWSRNFGDLLPGARPLAVREMAYDDDNNLILVGSISRTVDFGGGPLVKNGAGNDALIVKLGPTGDEIWSRRLGDDATGGAQSAFDVEVAPDGSILVLGELAATFDPGGGPMTPVTASDNFLVKLASNGTFLWQQQYQGNLQGIAVDGTGAIVITGTGPTNFGSGPVGPNYLVKLDSDATPVWTQTFSFPVIADVDFEGNIAIASTTSLGATASFGEGPIVPAGVTLSPGTGLCGATRMIGVAALDPSGAHRWSRGIVYTNEYASPCCGPNPKLVQDIAAVRHGGLDVSLHNYGVVYVDSLPPACPPLEYTFGYFSARQLMFDR